MNRRTLLQFFGLAPVAAALPIPAPLPLPPPRKKSDFEGEIRISESRLLDPRDAVFAFIMAKLADQTDRNLDFCRVMSRWPESGEITYASDEEIAARIRRW